MTYVRLLCMLVHYLNLFAPTMSDTQTFSTCVHTPPHFHTHLLTHTHTLSLSHAHSLTHSLIRSLSLSLTYTQKSMDEDDPHLFWQASYNGQVIDISRYNCLYELFDCATLCSNARFSGGEVVGLPTEGALLLASTVRKTIRFNFHIKLMFTCYYFSIFLFPVFFFIFSFSLFYVFILIVGTLLQFLFHPYDLGFF